MKKAITALALSVLTLSASSTIYASFFSAKDFNQYYRDQNSPFSQGVMYGFVMSALPQYLQVVSKARSEAYAKCWVQAYDFGSQTAPKFLQAMHLYTLNYLKNPEDDANKVFDLAMIKYFPPTKKILNCESDPHHKYRYGN